MSMTLDEAKASLQARHETLMKELQANKEKTQAALEKAKKDKDGYAIPTSWWSIRASKALADAEKADNFATEMLERAQKGYDEFLQGLNKVIASTSARIQNLSAGIDMNNDGDLVMPALNDAQADYEKAQQLVTTYRETMFGNDKKGNESPFAIYKTQVGESKVNISMIAGVLAGVAFLAAMLVGINLGVIDGTLPIFADTEFALITAGVGIAGALGTSNLFTLFSPKAKMCDKTTRVLDVAKTTVEAAEIGETRRSWRIC